MYFCRHVVNKADRSQSCPCHYSAGGGRDAIVFAEKAVEGVRRAEAVRLGYRFNEFASRFKHAFGFFKADGADVILQRFTLHGFYRFVKVSLVAAHDGGKLNGV